MQYVLDANIAIAALNDVGVGATLVTNDQALLDGSISGLRTENWLS